MRLRIWQILRRPPLRKADQTGDGDLQEMEQRPQMVPDSTQGHPDRAVGRAQTECGKLRAIKDQTGANQGQENGPDDEQVER